jgi:hypothetical protein
MRELLPLTLMPLFLAGCPCGAYTGAGDRVFARGTDSLILCENGGYSAMIGDQTIEGRYVEHPPSSNPAGDASIGTTGAHAFSVVMDETGTTMTTPGLGDGAWTEVTLDKTALDHADTGCQAVESRTWWLGADDLLPVDTAFTKPARDYATVEACQAAQTAGEYPATARCEYQLLLCANGAVAVSLGDRFGNGTYTSSAGAIAATSQTFASFTGIYVDGALDAGDPEGFPSGAHWTEIPLAQVAGDLRCH